MYNYAGYYHEEPETKKECRYGIHTWVDTGLIKSFCKLCDAEGEWCRQTCKYVLKGYAKWEVSPPTNSGQDT